MKTTALIGIAGFLLLAPPGCGHDSAAPQASGHAAQAAAPVVEAPRVRGSVHSIRLPEIEPDLPDLPGRNTVATNCGVCHNPHYIMTQPPFSRETWTAEVTKMRKNYSAPVPEEKVEEIVEYLVSVRGTK